MASGFQDFLFDFRTQPTQTFDTSKYLVPYPSHSGRPGGYRATSSPINFTTPDASLATKPAFTQNGIPLSQQYNQYQNSGIRPEGIPQFNGPSDYRNWKAKAVQYQQSNDPNKAARWAEQYGPSAPYLLNYTGFQGVPNLSFTQTYNPFARVRQKSF